MPGDRIHEYTITQKGLEHLKTNKSKTTLWILSNFKQADLTYEDVKDNLKIWAEYAKRKSKTDPTKIRDTYLLEVSVRSCKLLVEKFANDGFLAILRTREQ